jgi:hypothetical protein
MRAKRMTRRPRRRKEKKLAIFHSTATHTALPLSEICDAIPYLDVLKYRLIGGNNNNLFLFFFLFLFLLCWRKGNWDTLWV